MKYAFFIAALLCLAVLVPVRAQAGSLTVTVNKVPDPRGHVLLAVCTKAEFLSMHCHYTGSAPAKAGAVTITVPNVAPGVYAVQAWHDANDNHQIDRNAIGIPTEAMGFSRDAKMWFGPPRFANAAVQIGTGDSALQFSLRSF